MSHEHAFSPGYICLLRAVILYIVAQNISGHLFFGYHKFPLNSIKNIGNNNKMFHGRK